MIVPLLFPPTVVRLSTTGTERYLSTLPLTIKYNQCSTQAHRQQQQSPVRASKLSPSRRHRVPKAQPCRDSRATQNGEAQPPFTTQRESRAAPHPLLHSPTRPLVEVPPSPPHRRLPFPSVPPSRSMLTCCTSNNTGCARRLSLSSRCSSATNRRTQS